MIDADDRHGGEEECPALAAECKLPETAPVRTPNGCHYCFARPPDIEQIGNRTGIKHGINVREGGGEYIWGVCTEPEDEISPPAALPAAQLKIIRAQAAGLGAGAKKSSEIDFPPIPASARAPTRRAGAGRGRRMPPDIAEGSRNDMLARIAGHLVTNAVPLNWESSSAQMKRIAVACCKPLLDDPKVLESMARRFTVLERRKRQATI